jgi:transcriptional regulator with XRE-family HTH domain
MKATEDERVRAQRFGAYVSDAARQVGYDLDSPRGGGKTQLAKNTGMSLASVSRMISGQVIPDPKFFESLARALSIPLVELLVRSGLVSSGALDSSKQPAKRLPLTVREAAVDLGIVDPSTIAAFESMVKVMLNSQQSTDGSSRGRESA